MPDFTPLPFRSSLVEYEKQGEELLTAWRAGDPGAIQAHWRFEPVVEAVISGAQRHLGWRCAKIPSWFERDRRGSRPLTRGFRLPGLRS
jgi:hypothetical protein